MTAVIPAGITAPPPLTPARLRALAILRDHPGVTAGEFALLMWPDSKGHRKVSRRSSTPAGGAMGAGIKMSAGVFLWRLVRSGLAWSGTTGFASHQNVFSISAAGQKALETAA